MPDEENLEEVLQEDTDTDSDIDTDTDIDNDTDTDVDVDTDLDSDSDTDSDTDNDGDSDSDTDDDSRAIERLVLPRPDWYDEAGRINKDALIANFNAIEAKLNELARVSAFDISAPDFSTFNYDDTTLASDDNKIVNLKSFIDIMHLKGMPLVCDWDDKVLTKLQYYNDSYSLVTISDADLSELGSNNKIWVYLDYSDDLVYISADGTNPNNDILIACYDNGIVHSLGGLNLIDVNILEICANMRKDIITTTMSGTEQGFNYYNGNRVVGVSCRESRGQAGYPLVFRDMGAK